MSASPYGEDCCKPGASDSPANLTPHPPGKEVKIAGIDCYSVGDESCGRVVVISPDVFGWRYLNNRATADSIAGGGFHVVLPDTFEGDPFTPERFASGGMEELKSQWWPHHTQEKTSEFLVKVAQELKKDSKVRSIQAVGYCYGTMGVLLLGKQGLASSGVCAHPTGFTTQNVNLVTIPLLFLCAETDFAFTPEIRQHWEKALKERGSPARFIDFPGTQHGFAVRDDGSPNGVLQRQRALQETIAFFKQGAAA